MKSTAAVVGEWKGRLLDYECHQPLLLSIRAFQKRAASAVRDPGTVLHQADMLDTVGTSWATSGADYPVRLDDRHIFAGRGYFAHGGAADVCAKYTTSTIRGIRWYVEPWEILSVSMVKAGSIWGARIADNVPMSRPLKCLFYRRDWKHG